VSEAGVPSALAVAGGLGAALALVGMPAGAGYGGLPAVVLALLWWGSGVVATRARPDHLSARLLLAVGATHLAAFGVTIMIGLMDSPDPTWAAWAVGLLANTTYALGFAALATLLVVFPDAHLRRRSQRVMTVASVGAAAGATALYALTAPSQELAGEVAVPAPPPLPIGSSELDLFGLVMLLVVVGLISLVVRTRRAQGEARRQLMWPLGVASVLVVMLATTPAGTALLGDTWTLVFVPIVGALPLALLAGIVRYRLLEVDLYVVRTLAYGLVLALVIVSFALAAWLANELGGSGSVAAVAVAVLAALVAHPLRLRLQAVADRVVSGGRVGRRAAVAHLNEALDGSDSAELAERTADTVHTGLDVSWVRVRFGGSVLTERGVVAGPPAAVVPLVAAGEELGALECGPRHGGWGEDDMALLSILAGHAALALRGADLAAALEVRMQEVVESRARLVRAEDEVRRQLERDLHDGIQQQLVVLLARLELLRAMIDEDSPARAVADLSHEQARRSLVELRDVVRGVHAPLLEDRGLISAVESQADRLPIPVTVDVDPRLEGVRYSPEVEAAAYYVFCEATTNVIKHSGASRARVVLSPWAEGGLQVAVGDEGCGFAGTGAGTGLTGLRDRVDALNGQMDVLSAPGVGTTVVARFPRLAVAHA
jgi:signal transduction histidine kinase